MTDLQFLDNPGLAAQLVLDQTPVCVCTLDLEFKLQYFNAASSRFFKLTPADLGKHVDSIVQVFKKGQFRSTTDAKGIRQRLLDKEIVSGEYEVSVHGGKVLLLHITASPLFIAGNLHGFSIIFQDISETRHLNKIVSELKELEDSWLNQKQELEKRLKEKEEMEIKLAYQQKQLVNIYDTVTDIIFMLDVEGEGQYRFISVNKSFLDATGLSQEQIIGKMVTEVIPQPSLNLVLGYYKKALTTGNSVSWEEKTPYPSGTKTGIVTITPVSHLGQFTQLVGSVHDITDRIGFEEDFKKMYTLVESSPNYVSIIEPDDRGTYHYMNHSGKQLLGINVKSISDITAQKTIGIAERNRLKELMVKKGGQITEETYFSNQTTGEIIPMLLNAFQIEVGGKPFFACIGLDLRDITQAKVELETANLQLRQLTEHLQKVRDTERITIAREIHDELGQLLTAIKMDVFWALNNAEKKPQEVKMKLEGAIEMISHTLKSVRRIVSDLRPDLLEDLGLVEAIKWHLEQTAVKTGLNLKFQSSSIDDRLPPFTSLTVFRICQEAITNVIKHARATEASVELLMDESLLSLKICDNGIGFNRQEVDQKNSFGLQGIKERVAVCGGSLSIDSKQGMGTTIFITIPLQPYE